MFSVVVFVLFIGISMTGTENLPEYRLPGDVIPNNYVVEVTLDVCNAKYYGRVNIQIKCDKPTSTIKLHSKGLTIGTEVYISKGEGADKVEGTFTFEPNNDFLIITVPKELQVGVTYTLTIPYEGDLMNKQEGLYLYEPTSPADDQNSWYIATNVRTRARFFFPCFDEPALRATFTLKVMHHPSLKAISTMAAVEKKESGSLLKKWVISPIKKAFKTETTMESICSDAKTNMVWEEFHETPLMPPYKLGLVVAVLSMIDLNGVGRLWFLKHKPIKPTTSMFKLIPKMFQYLRSQFDSDSSLPKMDLVVLKETKFLSFYGAIIIPEKMILQKKIYSAPANLIAHALASQWIDSNVCIKWWSDLWFTWALAEYMAIRAFNNEQWNPDLKSGYGDIINYSRVQMVYEQSEEQDCRVYKIINRPEEIYNHWGTIAFTIKGPLLIRMLHLYVGDTEFKDGMNIFFQSLRRDGTCADHDDLWKAFESLPTVSKLPEGVTIAKFMNSWITQTGFPLVTLTRKGKDTNAAIYASQLTYRKSKDQEKDPSEKCWVVPLSILYSKNDGEITIAERFGRQPNQYTTWLICEEREKTLTDFPLVGNWYAVNPKLGGLYKVKHDAENWKILTIAVSNSFHANINVMNRAELVDEVLYAARKDEIDYKTALNFFHHLTYEVSWLPWRAAQRELKFLKRNLSRQTGYKEFEMFIRKCMLKTFEKSQGLRDDTDIVQEMVKDIMKWACEFDSGQCRDETYKLFDLFMKWKKSPRRTSNPVPRHLRRLVYCNGMKRGYNKHFEKMIEFLERSEDDEQEIKNMVFGLSCVRREELLRRYLDRTVDKGAVFPKHLASYAFRKVVANDNGFNVALQFMTDNKKYISGSKFSNHPLVEYVAPLAARAISTEELEQIKSLMGPENVQQLATDLQEAFKSAEENMVWLQNNGELVNLINRVD